MKTNMLNISLALDPYVILGKNELLDELRISLQLLVLGNVNLFCRG